MTWVNYSDVEGQLLNAGFDSSDSKGWPPEVGKMRRCRVAGCSQKGWYALHEITLNSGERAVVGAYGWWKGAEKFEFKVALNLTDGDAKLTKDQQDALRKRIAEDRKAAEAARRSAANRAAARAASAWRQYSAEGSSEYLTRKGVGAHGVRFTQAGSLVIPLLDANSSVRGLQLIYPKGHPKVAQRGRDKDFWPAGLEKKGTHFLIGSPGPITLVAEGYATGASLHEATGLPVAIAWDAGNLGPALQVLAKTYRRTRWLVCGDDDFQTEGNPGLAKAEAAALAVGGAWVAPQFSDRGDQKLTDFNDLHLAEGLHVVRAQIEAKLAALKWGETTPPTARAQAHQGGGETQSGRREAASVMGLDDIVDRFIPLDDGTGEYVFDKWTNKVVKKSQMLALLQAGVRGDDIKRHPVWITRGAYYLSEVGFDPSGKDRDVKLNTWQGWPMTAAPGSCEVLKDLARYLCGSDAVYDWLIKWLAYPLQNPGAKMGSAVVMHGPQGTGKSTLFQIIRKIYGRYGLVIDQDAIEDKFNSDWGENILFIVAEEIVSRAEMWHVKNKLKNLVTGETIRINPKGMVAYSQKNHINIVYLSNENQPLPLENDDRRHLVIYTPPALPGDFYRELYDEIEDGGTEAFYHFLLHYPLADFRPNTPPPMTEAKRALIEISAASEIRFINEWALGDLGLPVGPCLSADLYDAYLRWCRRNGESRPRPSNHFFGAIGHARGFNKNKLAIFESITDGKPKQKPIVIPPTAAMERAGTNLGSGENEVQWRSKSVRAFTEALQNNGQEGNKWAA